MAVKSKSKLQSLRLEISAQEARRKKRILIYASYMKDLLLLPAVRIRISRNIEKRSLYENSTWGMILSNPKYRDPLDRKGGIIFQRRFRVSYPMFQHIVSLIREKKWFTEGKDCSGRKSAPLELKVFGVLRVLSRLLF